MKCLTFLIYTLDDSVILIEKYRHINAHINCVRVSVTGNTSITGSIQFYITIHHIINND